MAKDVTQWSTWRRSNGTQVCARHNVGRDPYLIGHDSKGMKIHCYPGEYEVWEGSEGKGFFRSVGHRFFRENYSRVVT